METEIYKGDFISYSHNILYYFLQAVHLDISGVNSDFPNLSLKTP